MRIKIITLFILNCLAFISACRLLILNKINLKNEFWAGLAQLA